MKKAIIGGVITLIIGGTGYTISQSSVVNNLSKNTGMSQQQAQQYYNNSQSNLESFTEIGQEFVTDGSSILGGSAKIDCNSYTYSWQTPTLDCAEGQNETQTIGNDEVQLGNCYGALGTNLGSVGSAKINECITDIDTVDADYNLPIAGQLENSSQINDFKNSNLYNKSVLQSALQSN